MSKKVYKARPPGLSGGPRHVRARSVRLRPCSMRSQPHSRPPLVLRAAMTTVLVECLDGNIKSQCSHASPSYDILHIHRIEKEVQHKVSFELKDDLPPVSLSSPFPLPHLERGGKSSKGILKLEMEVTGGEEEGFIREWTPCTHMLNLIPPRVQNGLFSTELYLTCIDAVSEYIALGTNVGLVYWYNRKKGNIQRLRCEATSSAITFVKIVNTVDYMVGAGNVAGQVTVFQIPKEHPENVPEALKPKVEPKVERWESNVDTVLEKVEQDQHISSYNIAEELGIDYKRIWTYLMYKKTQHLGLIQPH
ncbi:WD repeat-containing protein CG11141 [Eumeta japonica]|uniref:WD repeat-containing protein CG11141 n=1 Tax=Eumeta variegata TaxID=151549 RepID=A0A4C1WK55_EUMVA|nr:WD repeat-containing protein CG11141 [Eumeta japonica]